MSDFWFYVSLGFNHVLDWNGYDHMLFLAVLVVGYSFKNWRRVLSLVTLFTIGHMASLAYASVNVLDYDRSLIEFLIPVTILLTAIHKFISTYKSLGLKQPWILYVGTVFFGLIHGLGFASFFRTLDEDSTWPLIEFALGIEGAQVVIVLAVLLLGAALIKYTKLTTALWTYIICAITTIILLPLLIGTWPF